MNELMTWGRNPVAEFHEKDLQKNFLKTRKCEKLNFCPLQNGTIFSSFFLNVLDMLTFAVPFFSLAV